MTDQSPLPQQADPALIAQFRKAATAVISDNLARLPGAVGLRPFHRGGTMAGTALTVRVRPATISSSIRRSNWCERAT